MTAALEAARAGHEVVLVEKEAQLGGWLKSFSRLFPKKAPYRELEPVDLESRIREIDRNDQITVYRAATIEGIGGQRNRPEAPAPRRDGHLAARLPSRAGPAGVEV